MVGNDSNGEDWDRNDAFSLKHQKRANKGSSGI